MAPDEKAPPVRGLSTIVVPDIRPPTGPLGRPLSIVRPFSIVRPLTIVRPFVELSSALVLSTVGSGTQPNVPAPTIQTASLNFVDLHRMVRSVRLRSGSVTVSQSKFSAKN
jgi:hypothetical protein